MTTITNFNTNFSFDYHVKRFGITMTKVKVNIVKLPNGNEFVLISDTGDNHSLKNWAQIATTLKERFDLDPIRTRWGSFFDTHKNEVYEIDPKWDPEKKEYKLAWVQKANDAVSQYVLGCINNTMTLKISRN